jgi:Ca2+-binding EF-hand superfamily protein
MNFNRDELYAILNHIKQYFPGKKADYLFFNSNRDNDNTMDVEEFIDMWMEE